MHTHTQCTHHQLRIFFLLRTLRMRTLKHRLLCALNHFRSVEKKLVYDDWGYAFEDKLQFFNASAVASSSENCTDHSNGNANGSASASANGNANGNSSNAKGGGGGGHKSSSATALPTPLDPSGSLPVMPGHNQVGHPAVQKMLGSGSGSGKDSGSKSASDLGAAAGASSSSSSSSSSASSSSSSSSASSTSSATPQPYFQARW